MLVAGILVGCDVTRSDVDIFKGGVRVPLKNNKKECDTFLC